MALLLLFSFLAGIITVMSPCILPILPILLAVSIGQGRYRPLGIVVGLIISFTFFTLMLTSLVNLFGISPNLLRFVAIGLIAFFGLSMLFEQLNNLLSWLTSYITRIGTSIQETTQASGQGFLSGFIFGIALGLIWTPCAGPVLATIATLVATGAITFNTVIITLAYSIGCGIPLFLIAYGGNTIISALPVLTRYSTVVRKIFGILLIASAVAIAFHVDVVLQQLTLNYFPVLHVEQNKTLQKELEELKTTQPLALGEKAPALTGITAWINSPPLSLDQLLGKVVLVDFWTYSCINCVRTLPYLKQWYDTYKDKGFILIGVHTPEFEFEKSKDNVQNAVTRFGITYPVALDSNYKTWLAYDNHYWPAHYLIDQQGIVRDIHFGEGAYTETENMIRKLLNLPPLTKEEKEEARFAITPETYLGYERANRYAAEIKILKNQTAPYTYAQPLEEHQVGLRGTWLISPQSVQAHSDGAALELRFKARHVYLVMESATPQSVEVLLDQQPLSSDYQTADMKTAGQITVQQARMYAIVDLPKVERHLLTLKVPRDVVLYVFTFG